VIAELVNRLYPALAVGDRATIEGLIAAEFTADFSPGYGPPIGGRHVGADAIDHGWWEIGRRYSVRAEPQELIPTADGRLLVLGTYRGRPRATPEAARFAAPFAHLWTAAEDRLTALWQITDTLIWMAEPTVSHLATD
jgi:ketosteroid isomerase-like protein